MDQSPILARRSVGKTALQVSVLGFGGAPLGGFRSDVDDKISDATIATALASGISYFDTAPFYGYGRSEQRLGRVLSRRPEGSFVLSSKVGRVLEKLAPGEDTTHLRQGGRPYRPRFDYSYDGAIKSWEQSKKRLNLERIDLLYIHDVDNKTHVSDDAVRRRFDECLKGAIPALRDLREAGEISAFGVGLNETRWCKEFLKYTDIDCIMTGGLYTLLDQDALDDLLPLCERRQTSLIVGGPYNSGILATGAVAGAQYYYEAASSKILNRVRRMQAICDRHGVSLQAAALNFPLGHPAVSSVVAGATRSASVTENFRHLNAFIPDTFWQALKAENLINETAPTPQRASVESISEPGSVL